MLPSQVLRDDIAALAQMAAGHASNLMVHKTRAQKLRQEQKAAAEAVCFESYADSVARVLPEKLAYRLKWMMWDAAWHAANWQAEYQDEAATALTSFKRHSYAMKKLLHHDVAENLKWMAWHAAWSAAYARANLDEEAEGHQEDFDRHAAALARPRDPAPRESFEAEPPQVASLT